MTNLQQFRLPDAGEGLTEAEIISWKVRPGDVVAVNDPIVEIETAKSLVELPSPFAGVVVELLAPEGVTVAVGTPIVTVDVAADTVEPAVEPAAQRTAVLVGYGPRNAAPTRRPRRGRPSETTTVSERDHARALAKPPVRKLARDRGVDLASVVPTGPNGVVTRDDVERAAASGSSPGRSDRETPDRELRVPIKGVRRATAAAMVASAFTAPHVSVWMQVDVTRSVALLRRLRPRPEFEGLKISPLLLIAKALLLAVRRHPEVNASWDEAAGEIVLKRYVNLGIAVASPRGLLVPNIKDADRLGLRELAQALAEATEAARHGRCAPSDLTGGTITITNVGVFGVDGGTPILNPGEAAILAVGKIAERPWVHRGRVRPRWVTTLSLSFDHRLVDGGLGSTLLADVAAVLNDPAHALLLS